MQIKLISLAICNTCENNAEYVVCQKCLDKLIEAKAEKAYDAGYKNGLCDGELKANKEQQNERTIQG